MSVSYPNESDSRMEDSPQSTGATLEHEHIIQKNNVFSNGKTSHIRQENNTTLGASPRTEKELFNILNSQSARNGNSPQIQQISNSRPPKITDADLAFLKAANEIVKMNESKVDPTIRDILSRLQYSNSPHGGMPISQDYLKSIDVKTPGTTSFMSPSHDESMNGNENENVNENVNHRSLPSINTGFPSTATTPQANQDLDLRNRMSLLSTEEMYPSVEMIQKSPANLFVPPFTENPLRNPPNNLDFPHFSLDIFKSPEEINPAISPTLNSGMNLQNILAQNLTASLLAQHNQQQRGLVGSPQMMNMNIGAYKPLDSYSYARNGDDMVDHHDEGSNVHDDHDDGYEVNGEEDGEGETGELDEDNYDDEEDREGYESDSDEEYHQEGNRYNEGPTKIDKRRGSASARFAHIQDGTPRNYKCRDCEMGFKRSSDLKRHEKIHLKVPPNICPQCRKGFARRDALKRHVNTLTCKRNRQKLLKELADRGETLPDPL